MLKKIKKIYPYYATWPGCMINTHLLEIPLFRTYFHGSKSVRSSDNDIKNEDTENPLKLILHLQTKDIYYVKGGGYCQSIDNSDFTLKSL